MLGFSYPGQTYPAGYPFLGSVPSAGAAPYDRTLFVAAETRTHLVARDLRTYVVPPEDRTEE